MKTFLTILFLLSITVIVNAQKSNCEKLIDATIQGDTYQLKKIIKTKIDVNCISKAGSTSLGIACSRGNIEFVKLLLKNKANPNIPQYYNGQPLGTPLFDALKFCEQILEPKLVEPAQLSLKKRKKTGYLCDTEIKDEITRLLIQSGADVKYTDSDKTTSLMIATMFNRNSILKFLIEQGVDINAQNNYGNSALIYAVSNNDYSSTKILIESRANISLKNKDGKTAFAIAKENKFVEILKLFKK